MASQGPGRKRTPNRTGVTPEEDALNVIAREMSDDEESMLEGSRSNVQGSSQASILSLATLTSSRKGSGGSSVTADTETSLQDIKEIHELKDQIHDVEAKYTQNLKEMKDSLAEMERKYRKAMVSNAQLDNEKSNLMYEVDTLKDSLMELEELLAETRRECEEKSKDLEREKHAHSILQFQFNEQKETLKQSEELLTALERQKEFSDAIRNERDELRDEVVQLKDSLKKHGIVFGLDLCTNGNVEENVTGESACSELQQGSSVLEIRLRKLVDEREILIEQVTRLEGQVTRYRSAAENAEKVEDELKAEKRKLQRELRSALDKIEELESNNSHLNKRLEKMKTYRGMAASP
ncbi:leucine-rich repeat flightless-interacting protein 2 isoform X21 [Silurus meridionalis]|nr:leucine-rich repeat flightless-interacting protein 2 isoform X21 [Silurus meridionalis]